MINKYKLYLAFLVAFSLFVLFSQWRGVTSISSDNYSVDRVVISAPVLAALFGGDRYLAANLEVMRLASTGVEYGYADIHYLVRAQNEVAYLNPCHEDNYYLANGLLTWGGADQEGSSVLLLATKCRFWDELPPFLYGFNKYFFERNIDQAVGYLELAAKRATDNAAGFRKLAIMLRAEQINDEAMALKLLKNEYESSSDRKLKEMLSKRIIRLEGLLSLRNAQREFEKATGNTLASQEQLIESGFLESYPVDPLGIGFEFVNGVFVLRKLKVAGAENL
jgi:hypothetical protein